MPFDIVVNAVDDNWFPVPAVNHTIHLTSDDLTAVLANDTPLANGKVTIGGSYFGTEGTWTITASDLTDDTKKPATSGTVVVNP